MFIHTPLTITLPELQVEEIDDRRYYTTPEGNKYPSITTVLEVLSKAPIEKWRKRIGEKKADQITQHACDRGTELHAVVESYLKNEEPVFEPNSRVKFMFNWMKFRLNKINNIIAQEIPLYSDALKVAGRCDCIAEYEGVLSIIDFKTANKAKIKEWIDGYFQQTTGYSLMFEERTGIKIEQVVILIVGEEDFSVKEFKEQRCNYVKKVSETIDLFNKSL